MGRLCSAALAVSLLLACAGGASASPARAGKTDTSQWFLLPAGAATRTFTMRRPYGIFRLSRLTTTFGIRASVEATSRHLLAASLSNDSRHEDPARTCRRKGDLEVCTQDLEGCPASPAVWRVRLVKEEGPAGFVRFDFVVG